MSELIYGRRSVAEALKAGSRRLSKIWMQNEITGPDIKEIIALAQSKNIPIEWVGRSALDRRVHGNHQGVAAQGMAHRGIELDEFLENLPANKPVLVVGLDEIQDPQNVGAILRSAGFFGVQAVLLPKWRSAPVTESAARVSSGAVEHVPVIRIVNLAEAIRALQKADFQVIGADMAGEPIQKLHPAPRCALIMGNEGEGMRRLVKERCDKLVSIPGRGKVASLNVSAAAAIFLNALSYNKAS